MAEFTGLWIPAEVWTLKISIHEKVLLSQVIALDNENGCTADNKYFADFLGVSKVRVSEIINSLCKKGLLTSQIKVNEGNKRILKRSQTFLNDPNKEKFNTLANFSLIPSQTLGEDLAKKSLSLYNVESKYKAKIKVNDDEECNLNKLGKKSDNSGKNPSSSSSPNKFDFQNLNYEESVELFNKHKKHFFSIYPTELNAKEQIVFYANEICSARHDLIRVEYELLPFDTNQFLGVLKSKITGSFEMFYRELKILKNYSCFEDKESELKKDLYLIMEDLIKEYKFKGFNEFQHIFNSFKKRASKNLVQKSKSVTVGNYA